MTLDFVLKPSKAYINEVKSFRRVFGLLSAQKLSNFNITNVFLGGISL